MKWITLMFFVWAVFLSYAFYESGFEDGYDEIQHKREMEGL